MSTGDEARILNQSHKLERVVVEISSIENEK